MADEHIRILILISLLILLAVWLLISLKKQKQQRQSKLIEKKEQSPNTQENPKELSPEMDSRSEKESSPKKSLSPEKDSSSVQLDNNSTKKTSEKPPERIKKPLKTENLTNSKSNQKQEQNTRPEEDIIKKALTYYESYGLESKESIQIEDIIISTSNDKILWTEGKNDEGSIEVWAADYQKGLLALFRDMKQKKYQLIFFDNKKGFIQPYAKIVELRKAIATQIENRKKHLEPVPTSGFLVRTNTFKCTKNHGIEDIIAVFTVLSKTGKISVVETPAGHCAKCGVFYIHEYIYQKLLTYGQPLCTVISEKQYISGAYLKMNPGMAQQSLLRMCGYTVSSTEGLSDVERQRILNTIISSGIMSKYDVITYINYFIIIRKNDTKDMSEAIGKWKRDIRYVEGLNVNTLKRYKVDRVYRIEK